MLILMVIVQWLFLLSLPSLADQIANPLTLAFTAALVGLMLVAAIIASRRASIAVLALLIARYLVVYLLF
jgi:hypothetical protein